MFKPDGTVLLDATCSLRPQAKARGRIPKVEPMAADTSPWERRLVGGHWRRVECGFDPRGFRRVGEREIWEKPCAGSVVKLCREVEDVDFRRFGGPYFEVFWLESDGELIPLEGASWADWDGGRRLVLVRDGRLFAAQLQGAELVERELLDLNPLQPRQLVAPGWARQW